MINATFEYDDLLPTITKNLPYLPVIGMRVIINERQYKVYQVLANLQTPEIVTIYLEKI